MNSTDQNEITSSAPISDKTQLRRELRERRRQLSAEEQNVAAEDLKQRFLDQQPLLARNLVGLYFPNDGEINPLPLASWLEENDKICHLPVIDRSGANQFKFASYSTSDQQSLVNNRFDIPEPATGKLVSAGELDLILLPLVGFDSTGNRIGMGKGFYDRTLAEIPTGSDAPLLIGLAHQCQQVDCINSEAWDIPLNGILTDKKFYRCH